MEQRTLKDWMIATRPWSFPASVISVLASLAYLYYLASFTDFRLDWLNGFVSVVGIIFFHTAGNLLSDYQDYKKGVDAADTYGAQSLTGGKFTLPEIKKMGILFLMLALATALFLLFRSGWQLLWIGGLGIINTLFYPAFKYRAWGDFNIFITFGLLPPLGTAYVVTGLLLPQVLWIGVPVGLITTAILHANNIRDMVSDSRAGIVTLAMKLGRKRAVLLYCLLITIPFAWISVLAFTYFFPVWVLLSWVTFPLVLANLKMARRLSEGESVEVIAHLDEKTAQLQLAFGLVFSFSFVIGTWIG